VRVRGFLTSTGAHLELVQRGNFPVVPALPNSSPLQVVATDTAGRPLGSAPLKVTSAHTDGAGGPSPVLAFEGSVPAAAAQSVQIIQNGAPIARRDRSAHAPRAAFISPRARDTVGRSANVIVRWKASDPDGTPVETTLDYSADGGRTYRRIYVGPNTGRVVLPREYFSGAKRARLRLTADDGFNQTAVVSGVFRSLGAPPVVHISTPPAGATRMQNATFDLSGFAFDDAGRRLVGRALSWYEGRKLLGRGEAIGATGLGAGPQRLRLVARDVHGRTGESSVVVRLLPVQPDFLSVVAPAKLSRRARSVTLVIASTVETTLSIGSKRYTVDSTPRRVKVAIRPGKAALKLDLVLGAGRLTARRSITIARR
jgi:hypothetical protein